MSAADTYNAGELAAGRLKASHITEAVRIAQQELGLEVDGCAGPATQARLDGLRAAALPLPALIVAVAASEIGRGETTANNRGEDIERYLSGTGIEAPAEWCAAFAGWCYLTAHTQLGAEMPFVRSVGAKRLVDRLGAAGSRFMDPALLEPGDLVAWHRGPEGSASGHVAVVERYARGLVHTIAGNEGSFPSRVRRGQHDVRHERLYAFATLRKNVG